MDQTVELAEIDQIVARLGRERKALIPILHAIQNKYRYLPEAALRRVCEITEITPAELVGVASFYDRFRFTPAGRHTVRVCVGTACHVKGSEKVVEALHRHLEIPLGSDTDSRHLFTVEKVACLGCCTLAPVVQIDSVTYGHMRPGRVAAMLEDFLSRVGESRLSAQERPRRKEEWAGEIRVGLGSCCVASGTARLKETIEASLREAEIDVSVKRVGCVGMCHRTPLIEVVPANGKPVLYSKVREEHIPRIVARHFPARGLLHRIRLAARFGLEQLLTDEVREPLERYSLSVRDEPVADFLNRQKRIATEGCGAIDPTDLEEYRAHGGFAALERCLKTLEPEEVVQEIDASGLRGRGGAGFPTGRKWQLVRRAAGERKFIVCNGDEGDPGAFMDRMILESFPYRVIEGMLIAAYAVGATHGYFYIRAEYPLALQRIREALKRCEEASLIGHNILGSAFSIRLEVVEGAGAFVCGEETALIASIEGRRGMPRWRPPYPAEKGLWGYPTLINNCETFAVVPWIIRNGADSFAAFGTEKSKGTKVFALAGKVARGGLIEVPMGITIKEIVEAIGGGVGPDRKFKAVQIGGPSGGCVPAALADIPVDYEALLRVGAMMGSGGLVVLDDTDCMVDIARYFLTFTQSQSCGKCTFCRVGTRRMLDILEQLCAGKGRKRDLEELEQLALAVKKGSLCQLGGTAPNPILTTLKYFREEYEAHLEGRCPARRCKALIRYAISEDCIGCTRCAQHCPVEAIEMRPYERHEIDPIKCTRCDTCRQVCPVEAVKIVDNEPDKNQRSGS
ncbi:MAG: NAD(P)H-dependent oxidoreductase subunit E [Kiritimatiellia bacterium]